MMNACFWDMRTTNRFKRCARTERIEVNAVHLWGMRTTHRNECFSVPVRHACDASQWMLCTCEACVRRIGYVSVVYLWGMRTTHRGRTAARLDKVSSLQAEDAERARCSAVDQNTARPSGLWRHYSSPGSPCLAPHSALTTYVRSVLTSSRWLRHLHIRLERFLFDTLNFFPMLKHKTSTCWYDDVDHGD